MSINKFGKDSIIRIETSVKNNKTYLSDLYFTAPFKVMSPIMKKDGSIQIILLTASAGIMSGDCQKIDIRACSGSSLEFTSQAYEKIHKMDDGEAIRNTNIVVEKNAELKYFPLPVIPFAKSAFKNETSINLKNETSKFSMIEILSSGRVAYNESFKYKYYISKTEIKLNSKLIYRDNSHYDPKLFNMNDVGMFQGYTHLANLIICNYNMDLKKIRNYIDNNKEVYGGATQFFEKGIVVKILGNQADELLKMVKFIFENCRSN